ATTSVSAAAARRRASVSVSGELIRTTICAAGGEASYPGGESHSTASDTCYVQETQRKCRASLGAAVRAEDRATGWTPGSTATGRWRRPWDRQCRPGHYDAAR